MIVLVSIGMITKKYNTKDFKFDPPTLYTNTKEIMKNTKEKSGHRIFSFFGSKHNFLGYLRRLSGFLRL